MSKVTMYVCDFPGCKVVSRGHQPRAWNKTYDGRLWCNLHPILMIQAIRDIEENKKLIPNYGRL